MTFEEIILTINSILAEKIIRIHPVNGGCIADNFRIETETNKIFFLKTGGINGMFTCESNGLKEIRKSQKIRVPEVINSDQNFLIIEFIKTSHPERNFFELFGEKLADMHRYTHFNFGFFEDNFIGKIRQINSTKTDSDSWTEFYFINRLLYQYKLAEEKGYISGSLKSKFIQLENKIHSILDDVKEPPSLLHGDLWAGNYLCDENNEPVLIDPAVYYGHRETDLAMTKLFGGFSPVFYESYQRAYPLAEGWEYRENIYKLYHIFNHLNMFGDSYLHEAEHLINYYL